MSQRLEQAFDIVFCVNATASMSSVVGLFQARAPMLHSDLTAAMQQKGKTIAQLRVRLVAFRDCYVDGDKTMVESDFFSLPGEHEKFAEFLRARFKSRMS